MDSFLRDGEIFEVCSFSLMIIMISKLIHRVNLGYFHGCAFKAKYTYYIHPNM